MRKVLTPRPVDAENRDNLIAVRRDVRASLADAIRSLGDIAPDRSHYAADAAFARDVAIHRERVAFLTGLLHDVVVEADALAAPRR